MTLLHRVFQKTGKTPDEIMAKPFFIRCFVFASMMIEIDFEKERAQEAARRAKENKQQKAAPRRRR